MLRDVAAGVRLLGALPRYLRHGLTEAEARAILAARLANRERDFLTTVRAGIFQNPASPYHPLLEYAACQLGDVERLVRTEGVEGALRSLCQHGVFLTVDEFKGRTEVIRGSLRTRLVPAAFANPASAGALAARSGGSTGAATQVPFDLASNRERSVNQLLAMCSRGGTHWVHAVWGVPGTAALKKALEYATFGTPLAHWFSPVDPVAAGLHPRYVWSARTVSMASRLLGFRVPTPVYVPYEDPALILRWMVATLRAGQIPQLFTYASLGVRLSRAAQLQGIDLTGAQLTLGGEPLTGTRLAAIRASGASAVPSYGASESGNVGRGCLAPEGADDLHLFHDLNAVIHPEGTLALKKLPQRATLLSSVRPRAHLVLLNASLGDEADITVRQCGCPMEQLGWHTHLSNVRSYEKVTAGGMAFPDTLLNHVLDDVLPREFGGGPTDYQLVETEASDGAPRLRLLVHPRVGPLDTTAVAGKLLGAVRQGSGIERITAKLWDEAGFVEVVREPPLATSTGKILHLRARRAGPPPPEQ